MNSHYGLKLWSSVEWSEQAVSWLDEQLAAAGIERTGEATQPHLQPWGTVLKVPTNQGLVWLKAPGPETAFEVELYRLFLRVTPDWVLKPIATDTQRGWLILPDGGDVLGDHLGDLNLAEALAEILSKYGRLQRDLMPHVDDLLSMNIADMRATAMPARFDEALEAVRGYLKQHGDAAGWEIHRQVTAMRDTFVSWCMQLGNASVPVSLDHNDLHPWNIFISGSTFSDDDTSNVENSKGVSQTRFYDWGDSVVAHPFASMLVALGFLRQQLDVSADDPLILRVRDAYLEVFSDLASHAELVEELELACQVGKAARVLTWHRSLQAQSYEEAGDFATAPLKCLKSLLDKSYLELGM